MLKYNQYKKKPAIFFRTEQWYQIRIVIPFMIKIADSVNR